MSVGTARHLLRSEPPMIAIRYRYGDLGQWHAEAVRLIDGGKRVGDGVYLHTSLLAEQSPAFRDLVTAVVGLAGPGAAGFNVLRVALRLPEVALLDYPAFFEDPFPSLRMSWFVDLKTGRVTASDFSARENPPILHRKELLLAGNHPDRAPFARLTAALESCGAFDHPSHLIGRRLYWQNALASLGIRLEGHEIILSGVESGAAPDGSPAPVVVARHRTAIVRNRLSAPMQALARWGFLDGTPTVLDYGCGRGHDVNILTASGMAAHGWDPHFAPDVPLEPAEVVNLGFVLNVIERPAERAEALHRAYDLAQRVLAIAVMTGKGSGAGHADGVLTSRGTFQRYFSQAELRAYIAEELNREPVTVAPGVVFVFRADEDEQAFLARRQRSAPSPPDRFDIHLVASARPPRPACYDQHRDLLDSFWATVLDLGRFPQGNEFTRADELASAVGSLRKAFAALPFPNKDSDLARAAARRADDLLVYLALNIFERRGSFQRMPAIVQRDIKGLFGSYKAAIERARGELFAAGNRERTATVAAEAAERGAGVLEPRDGDYSFHASLLAQQPTPVRIILGCAERLEAIPPDIDLVKVHGSGDRVSYLRFEGFAERALPVLTQRMVINLRTQRVAEALIDTPDGRRVLLGKARFMPADMPGRAAQERFDDHLRQTGVLTQDGLGPGLRVFARRLTAAGVKIPGAAAAARKASEEALVTEISP